MELFVYGKKNGCPKCNEVKDYYFLTGTKYTFVDVSTDGEAMGMMVALGLRSVPQIFKGDIHVGDANSYKEFATC